MAQRLIINIIERANYLAMFQNQLKDYLRRNGTGQADIACPVFSLWEDELIMRLYANNFSKAFSTLLKEKDISCYKMSRYSNLDQAYLSRPRNGDKHDPSPDTLIKISLALVHCSEQGPGL